ncbi:hypothetical protein H8D91_01840 [archaeon]|nr:hypothetical protein [archaeon]
MGRKNELRINCEKIASKLEKAFGGVVEVLSEGEMIPLSNNLRFRARVSEISEENAEENAYSMIGQHLLEQDYKFKGPGCGSGKVYEKSGLSDPDKIYVQVSEYHNHTADVSISFF